MKNKVNHWYCLVLLLWCCQLQLYAQKPLFNQKNLKGWYAYEPKTGKHREATEVFKVEKNMIRLYGDKLGYLMSEKSYKNFQLTVVFRWNTDSTFLS